MPKKSMVILTEAMLYVLMSLERGERCGIDIAEDIDTLTEGRVQIGPATLYTILGKFEKEKLIREISVEGRNRTYVITEKGLRAYETELMRLRQCIADSERISTEVRV